MEVKKIYLGYPQYYSMLFEFLRRKYEKEVTAWGIYPKPKFVHGIPRGGVAIALHLSHALGLEYVEKFADILYTHRDGVIYTLTEEDKKYLLVVDDVSDTGKTFLEFFECMNHKRFLTFTLYVKPHTKYFPTMYCEETSDWIVFPWEKVDEKPNREMYEHLGGE